MVSRNIFQIIEDNKGNDEIIADNDEVLEAIAVDYRANRPMWRVATTGADYVRWVRLSGGAGRISMNSHRELDQGIPMATFLIARDKFPTFYCEHIMQGKGCKESLRRIQEYQHDFDMKKDSTVASVPFTQEYAVTCLVEELGEYARTVKKSRRAEVNGNFELAQEWQAKGKDELTDVLVYLVKEFNARGWDMADSYYEKMERNHAEIDKGGGKFLGTAETEAK